MVKYSKALFEWLSQFGTVYEEFIPAQKIPKKLYITYSAIVDNNFATPFIQPFTIYAKAQNYEGIKKVAANVSDTIGQGGIILRKDWGYMTIFKGNPFYQNKADNDENIRAGYINLIIKIYKKGA